MSEKVLVVTGGGRGIGAAVCRLAAERGYALVINYASNAEAAEALVASIKDAGGEAVAVKGDVSQPADVDRIFAAADKLGRLVGLVNNAGVVGPTQRVEDMPVERIVRMLAVNVTGSFLCAQAAIRRLSTRHGGKGGSIVNLSSAAAKLGAPGVYVDYAAAKGAIDTFTVGLALEVAGDGIRVNAVRPGMIDTEIHASGGEPGRAQSVGPSLPMHRAGTAGEVANAVIWLLSDEASYCAGTILSVTGGRAILP
ncbi:MAG TPA: SDR family oxidoreductase [Devosiaceae bacterium]|jgi:NAD(P)-dependent dehydrogenase (short-subunit alcohol dehydrogenase family)